MGIFQQILRLTATISLLQCYPQLASACVVTNTSSPAFKVGSDGPADPATLGYNINHVALVVNNLETMQDFYGRVLGLRHVFTFQVTPDYTVVYMGHSQGGKNGTGFQTGPDLYAEKDNSGGLIELLYFNRCNSTNSTIPASTQRTNTFGHVGLIVPDVQATQERMEQNGVRILKRVGETPAPVDGPIAQAFGVGGPDVQQARAAALAGIRSLGFDNFLIITDPDGNLIEIQPQT